MIAESLTFARLEFPSTGFPLNLLEEGVSPLTLFGRLSSFRSEDSHQTNPDHHSHLQSTKLHQEFYDAFETFYQDDYHDFIRWLTAELSMPPETPFQKVPTLRVQEPGGYSVGEWHKDSAYGHVSGELNVWIPLTTLDRSSTMWIDFEDGFGPQPYGCRIGELLLFRGARYVHGNVPNTSNRTRVSLDFRLLLPGSEPSQQQTASAGKSLAIGDYFERLPK